MVKFIFVHLGERFLTTTHYNRVFKKGLFQQCKYLNKLDFFNPICDFSWRFNDMKDSRKPIAVQSPKLLEHIINNNFL